jgi:glutamate N-acetyltransferase/amino-acid N-acetyltransferase
LLAEVVDTTFNAISIDSDQSTSDTVALVSSGRIACPSETAFREGLAEVCAGLAQDVVRNGEGVKHVVRCSVDGAPDRNVARRIGKSVINSPLLQCAICGNDPNVGRLVMAVGKAVGTDYPELDLCNCRMWIGDERVFSDGVFHLDPVVEARLSAYLRQAQLYETAPPDEDGVFRPPVRYPAHERCVEIRIDLGCGDERFVVLGCDRTHEYISENADYRS